MIKIEYNEYVEEIKNKVMQYAYDIQQGKNKQGLKMRQAIDRFLNDLQAIEDGTSPYYMDWREVFEFDRWASMFKHTKGVLANQHIKLHISQLWEASNIFGFKRKVDGTRRFREVYIQKARKNAINLAFTTVM